MSKRFTDTAKWDDEWFLSLDNDYRIVWQYILDRCSPAGVFKKNFKLLNFCCNTSIDQKSFLKIFEDRVIDCGKFFFIPKFLKFQYPKGLNSDKPAVIGIRNELISLSLAETVRQSLGNDYLIVKEKETDKDKDKETDTEKETDKEKGDHKPMIKTLVKGVAERISVR